MTKAPCILFPYNAVMCNVVFTLKIPVIAADVKLNITTVHSHLGPLPTDPETLYWITNLAVFFLPWGQGIVTAISRFSFPWGQGTVTAIYLSRFPFYAVSCHPCCGKEQLFSSKGGGKIELSINLKSLKIKVFLTLSVVPDVTFSIPAMSAGEAFWYFWIFFKKGMGILQ